MTTLTKFQVDELINDDTIGFVCFMGGVGCDRQFVIYQAGDSYYLFQREEILLNTIEYQEVCNLQAEDSKAYLDGLM